MMNKRQVKGKGSAAVTIALCAGTALLVELVACVLMSIGVERAVVSEGSMSIAAYILRAVGAVIATILSWVIERENKVLVASIATAVTSMIPAVASMILWGVDIGILGVSLFVCAAILILTALMMSTIGDKGMVRRYKKHYR